MVWKPMPDSRFSLINNSSIRQDTGIRDLGVRLLGKETVNYKIKNIPVIPMGRQC